ncbi:MAG TPA: Gfo/Idh/MocA family oxidoreductase [Pirellula sp.]|nr:Gfo/Idh/MocA family oxidoreductase [Pirellula sp.]
MKSDISRRSFLSTASTTVAVVGATQLSAKSYGRVIGANDRIGVSVIGGGVIGNAHFDVINNLKVKNNLLPIAVADCWKKRADAGKEKIGALESHTEYRRVLDNKDLDYVVVATPEHWHWTMTIDAMDAVVKADLDR